jgi:hypothetical protein
VHIHFDNPSHLPHNPDVSPRVLPFALPAHRPGPRIATAPPTLPLQPMTRLIAFNDSLADLVSEVESLIDPRAPSPPPFLRGGGPPPYPGGSPAGRGSACMYQPPVSTEGVRQGRSSVACKSGPLKGGRLSPETVGSARDAPLRGVQSPPLHA